MASGGTGRQGGKFITVTASGVPTSSEGCSPCGSSMHFKSLQTLESILMPMMEQIDFTLRQSSLPGCYWALGVGGGMVRRAGGGGCTVSALWQPGSFDPSRRTPLSLSWPSVFQEAAVFKSERVGWKIKIKI